MCVSQINKTAVVKTVSRNNSLSWTGIYFLSGYTNIATKQVLQAEMIGGRKSENSSLGCKFSTRVFFKGIHKCLRNKWLSHTSVTRLKQDCSPLPLILTKNFGWKMYFLRLKNAIDLRDIKLIPPPLCILRFTLLG